MEHPHGEAWEYSRAASILSERIRAAGLARVSHQLQPRSLGLGAAWTSAVLAGTTCPGCAPRTSMQHRSRRDHRLAW